MDIAMCEALSVLHILTDVILHQSYKVDTIIILTF